MADPVQVRYPVPVRYVPRRGRTVATGYAPGLLPARLREFSASEAPLVAVLRLPGTHGDMPLRLHGGALWRPVLSRPASGSRLGEGTLDGRELSDWLAGRGRDADGTDPSYVGRHFAGTPLLARLPHAQGHAGPTVAWDRVRGGRLVEDGSARAESAAREFVEGDVALVDGWAHCRCRGPLAVTSSNGAAYRILSHPGAYEHFLGFRDADLCRIDRVQAHREAHRRRHGPQVHDGPPRLSWEAGALEGLLSGDDDVRLFVNEAPRWLACAATKSEPDLDLGLDDEGREALASTLAWGGVGGIGRHGLEDACLDVLRLARGGRAHSGIGIGLAQRVEAYAGRYALPHLAGAEPTIEDERAMVGL